MTPSADARVLRVQFPAGVPGARDHDVVIGSGTRHDAGAVARGAVPAARRAHLVADMTVMPLYGTAVAAALERANFAVSVTVLEPGESTKSWETAHRLHEALLDARMERRDVVVSCGGGVTSDLAGFVAATYLRGIAVIHVPTTLLAQVDAALGGKTGVNLGRGKNLVGAFHQPRAVLSDVETLATLPPREFRAGLAEVIKTAMIADAGLFADLETRAAAADGDAAQRDTRWLSDVVARTAAIKLGVVTRDETEAGERALLNFGHTVGHALEAATAYTRYLHGEAVAIGMLAAARLSESAGEAPAGTTARLEALLRRVGLPCATSAVTAADLLDKLQYDKKMKEGQARFVLTRGVGSATVAAALPDEIVAAAVQSILG